ncbi:MAG: tetratricopeptide repeat protein [Mediterranea sp.]|jgi:hypothetical protein|nr:tetratricopeptide repeat protein [Mediterranea sp.]
MTPASLQQWIAHPETLNRESLYELRTGVARYPYFQTLRLLYLKNLYLLHEADFGTELRKAALYVSDRRLLFYLMEGERYALHPRSFLKVREEFSEEPDMNRTLTLIDAYLAAAPQETTMPNVPDYATDYTYYLQDIAPKADAESPKLQGEALIDSFLRDEPQEGVPVRSEQNMPTNGQSTLENPPVWEEEDTGCFTETLARIYIKQHRYAKALEIIKRLSLNYPKRNAYFADQIRFLEKLIINAKSK